MKQIRWARRNTEIGQASKLCPAAAFTGNVRIVAG
jgi:hypothetical protein